MSFSHAHLSQREKIERLSALAGAISTKQAEIEVLQREHRSLEWDLTHNLMPKTRKRKPPAEKAEPPAAADAGSAEG
jgi:hypothetical protein